MRRNKANGSKRPQRLPTIAVLERLGVWHAEFCRKFSWRNGGGGALSYAPDVKLWLWTRPYGKCRIRGLTRH